MGFVQCELTVFVCGVPSDAWELVHVRRTVENNARSGFVYFAGGLGFRGTPLKLLSQRPTHAPPRGEECQRWYLLARASRADI